jgi:Flp pilus assembly protein TadG
LLRGYGCERGAAALEFAILLPVLLLLLYGFIEGSRVFQMSLAMSYAAREGARVLAVGTHDVAAATAAAQSRAYPLDTSRLGLNPVVDMANDRVSMTVTYEYDPLILVDYAWALPSVTVTMRAE